MIRYFEANDVKKRILQIVYLLNLRHIDAGRLKCFRSFGSRSSAVARCYALGKIWQKALGKSAHYIIEVLSEKFDRLPQVEQDKVLLHELCHIPKSFGGGFRHHDYACKRNVEKLYKKLTKAQQAGF